MSQASRPVIKNSAQLFKILGDSTRLSILTLLSEKEANVTTISKELGVEQSAVSHQLKLLKESRLVRSRREGKSMIYFPDDSHVYKILDQVFEHSREIKKKEGV